LLSTERKYRLNSDTLFATVLNIVGLPITLGLLRSLLFSLIIFIFHQLHLFLEIESFQMTLLVHLLHQSSLMVSNTIIFLNTWLSSFKIHLLWPLQVMVTWLW
jgi:hypothetical protein